MTRRKHTSGRPRGRPPNRAYHLRPVVRESLDVTQLTRTFALLAIYIDEEQSVMKSTKESRKGEEKRP